MMGGALIVVATSVSVALFITFPHILRLLSNNNKKKKNQIQDDHHPLDRIPSDVVLTYILSKLDLVSLCRLLAATNKFASLIPTITSLSLSFTLPGVFNYVHGGFAPTLFIETTFHRNRGKVAHFLERFSGLESITIELIPPPIYLTNPKSWFRWDSQIVSISQPFTHYYFVMVHATKVDDHHQGTPTNNSQLDNNAIITTQLMGCRYLVYHYSTARSLFPRISKGEPGNRDNITARSRFPRISKGEAGKCGNPHPKLKTIVSKDDNGRMTLHSKPEFDFIERKSFKIRSQLYYLKSKVLSLKNANVKIKDACVLFMYIGDVGDGTIQVEDLIMKCLNQGDYSTDDLKEALPMIISHPDALHIPLHHS